MTRPRSKCCPVHSSLSAEERRPEAEAAMRRALELGDAQGVAETDLLALQVDVLSD
jgi:hypothetical protein